MIHERDVRAKMAATVTRELLASEFADWIMSNSWNMHKDSTPEAVDLVSAVELLLAERDDAVYSEREFFRQLQALLDTIVVLQPATLSSARALDRWTANSALLRVSLAPQPAVA